MKELQVLLKQAITLHMDKQYQDAGRRYREVLSQAPDHSEALHGLGVLFHQAGNDLKALPLIYKAIQIDPNKPHYYSNIASVLRKLERYDDALKANDMAIQLDSKTPLYRVNQGLLLHNIVSAK